MRRMLKKTLLTVLIVCAPIMAQGQEYTRPETTVPFVDRKAFIEQFMDKKGFAVMEIWAEWCPYCKRSLPLMEKFHERHADEVPIRLIDYDKERSVIKDLGVIALPTILLFHDGNIVATYAGLPYSIQDLENWVRKRSQQVSGEQAIGGRLVEGVATQTRSEAAEGDVARGTLGGPSPYVPGGPVMHRDGKPYSVLPEAREIPEKIRQKENAATDAATPESP